MQCVDAIDCGAGQECVENECVATCQVKEDCPYFFDCDEEPASKPAARPIESASLDTFNALATCDEDSGECAEPCQTDAECADAFNYNFRACVEGTCQDVGCDTDEECRILGGSTATKWSCREPGMTPR